MSGALTIPVDPERDHILGAADARVTLVEYGSYACDHCHDVFEVVTRLRARFGDRIRYVYRHLPLADRELASRAAELVEYIAATTGDFWKAHEALMRAPPLASQDELHAIAAELGVSPVGARDEHLRAAVHRRVREDALSGIASGARATPAFFINGRRYDGAWDENALAEALVGSVGHRLEVATLNFARWAPSTGVLLFLATVTALVVSNTGLGQAFLGFWQTQFSFALGERSFGLSLVDWVNHGLLTVFFLVVGLEIKRELTVGRLKSRRAAVFPLAGAVGGLTVPAVIYLSLVPGGHLAAGWGMTIATDTAFAVALIAMLGDRVPVDLRVFLTAAVIVDDLVAIAVIAFVYTSAIAVEYLIAAAVVVIALVLLNRWSIYRVLPYSALGVALWFFLHEAGIHATLAGVLLAVITPTRPPGNLRGLMAQARAAIRGDMRGQDSSGSYRPSQRLLRELDTVHGQIESPASKLLRNVEPWSSYAVLPLFALANAGLVWSAGLLDGRGQLVAAIILGLAVGKPVGILAGAWLAVRFGLATKPATFGWRHVLGAGALGGIGFTMSLFIAGQALADPRDFAAAKVAIYAASVIAGVAGMAILLRRPGDAPAQGGTHE